MLFYYSNDNDEAKARANLEQRGYKKISPMEVKADALVKKLRPKYTECSEDLLRSTIMRYMMSILLELCS